MDNTIPFFIQQIKGLPRKLTHPTLAADALLEQCKWYFGHNVQVITFLDQATNTSRVVVYPADCDLVSAFGRKVHLHACRSGIYGALNAVLEEIRRRIGKCFQLGATNEAPILQKCEAPCDCLQQTVSLAMAREGCDGKPRLPSGEKQSAPVADLDDESDITTGSSILNIETSATQDIFPVIQKIQSMLVVVEQRMHHCLVETPTPDSGKGIGRSARLTDATVYSPGQVVPPNTERTITGGSSILSEDPDPAAEPAEPELFLAPDSTASTRGSCHGVNVTSESQMAMGDSVTGGFGPRKLRLDDVDEHTRELIREEICQVLASAMGSVRPCAPRGSGS